MQKGVRADEDGEALGGELETGWPAGLSWAW